MVPQSIIVWLAWLIPLGFCSPIDDLLTFYHRAAGGNTIDFADCRLNYITDVWTGCDDVLAQFHLTLDQFMEANPSIGDSCANFVPGETYCVALYSDRNIKVSEDGVCGAKVAFNVTCVGSTFGDCCGADGHCGPGEGFCGIGNCQEGSCLSGGPWSTDGKCGQSASWVPCPPKFGLCCSKDNLCGNGTACGTGCQYGDCSSATSTSTTVVPTPTPSPGSVSKDGTCAYQQKLICKGSKFGDCCSAAGYCGSTEYQCSKLLGCQSDYGTCSD